MPSYSDSYDSEDAERKKNARDENPKRFPVLFKLALFFACLIGFAYQASEFISHYRTYPTIIDMTLWRKAEFVVPAITYCIVTKGGENHFCKKFSQYCKEPSESYCKKFPSFCKDNETIPIVDITQPFSNDTVYLEDLLDVNSTFPNFLLQNPWKIEDGQEISGPYFYMHWWSLNVYTCYVLHSRVDSNLNPLKRELFSNESKMDKYQRYFRGVLQFNLDEKIFNPEIVDGVALHIHSPFYSALPRLDTILKPDRRYEIVIDLEEENLLPSPYGSDCSNYTKVWLDKGEKGPRAERTCVESCELTKEQQLYECVFLFNLYPNENVRRCLIGKHDKDVAYDHPDYYDIDDQFYGCETECKLECSKLEYKYTVQELRNDAWDTRGYYEGLVDINMYVNRELLVKTHRPQFQFVEVFSYLGGYMGIWLGISLFALADIIRNTIRVMRPRVKKVGHSVRESLKRKRAKYVPGQTPALSIKTVSSAL